MPTAIVVNAAAMLLESAPFILAGAICLRMPLRWSRLVAYLGCGCGAGPAARSLPAAVATYLAFGPLIAAARLVAAIAVDRFAGNKRCPDQGDHVLGELAAVTPPAIFGALLGPLLPAIAGAHAPHAIVFAIAAATAFVAAPCALGTVGVAGVMRGFAPAATAGFLCVAGIVDLRTWLRTSRRERSAHDVFAYALASLACALVAARSGAGLVNPKIAIALWPCAAMFGFLAWRHRMHACPALRVAPAIMLAGCVLAAPQPIYHATETTLAEAFAGERVDFTGVLTRSGKVVTLVRYAITCCRADAAPIAIRLDAPSAKLQPGWFHARGTLVSRSDGLRLRTSSIQSVAPPSDPFVYR